MKKDFLFIHSKYSKNKITIPEEINIGTNTKYIVGLYLKSCIRFYKVAKDYRLIKDRKIQRIVCASSQNFEIINNCISTNTKDMLINYYDYTNGVILADCEEYFDIIETDKLKSYMEENYFKSKYVDVILGNEKSLMLPFTDEKPPIKLKLKYINKKN